MSGNGNGMSTFWIGMLGSVCAVAFSLVAGSDLPGIGQALLMVVLGIGVLAAFTMIVIRVARQSDR